MKNMSDRASRASYAIGVDVSENEDPCRGGLGREDFSKLKVRTAKESRQKNFEQIAELGEEAALFGAARLAFPLPPRIGRWKRLI